MANLIGTSDLLNKNITWGDGSVENVRIDKDGYFILNGIKKKLFGFDVCPTQMPDIGDTSYFPDVANLPMFNATMAYLQSVGVRLCGYSAGYQSWALRDCHDKFLSAAYDYKMLIIGGLGYKYQAAFNNLETRDFVMGGHALSEVHPDQVTLITAHPNLITLYQENELDFRDTLLYTAPSTSNHLRFLTQLARPITNLPLTSKLMGYRPAGEPGLIQNEVLPFTSIPCYDIYESMGVSWTAICNTMLAWQQSLGKPASMSFWATEMGAPSAAAYQAADMTKEMIDEVFAAGAAVINLWPMYGFDWVGASFFNTDGTPMAGTIAADANLATYVATWQAAI